MTALRRRGKESVGVEVEKLTAEKYSSSKLLVLRIHRNKGIYFRSASTLNASDDDTFDEDLVHSGNESNSDDSFKEEDTNDSGGRRRLLGGTPLFSPYNPLLGDVPSVVPFGVLREGETEEAVQIPISFSVGETIQYIQQVSNSSDGKKRGLFESHDRIYVTESGILKGYISMASLLTNKPERAIGDIVLSSEETLKEGELWEDVACRLRNAKTTVAPIVDKDGYLVAVLNPTDLLQEMEIEATDDIMRFSGSGGGESYFGTPLLKLVFRRCSWLISLLMLQSLSSVILTHFQSVIERHIVIALFLTMLTGTAGNAGNQSSAMVIRGLATGEINSSNKMKCLWREAKAALIASFFLSIASFARVQLTPGSTMLSSVAVSIAMGCTVIGAVLFGTCAPLVLDKFGIDPVNFASPALATLTDVSGVLILCSVASYLLRGTP